MYQSEWSPVHTKLLVIAYQAGGDVGRISIAVGRSRWAVYAKARAMRLRRPSPRWTPAQDEALVELADAGVPLRTVADRIGRSYSAVRSRLHKLRSDER